MDRICFFDTEVSVEDKKAYDFGGVNEKDEKIHTGNPHAFVSFLSRHAFLCGHNIIDHDAKFLVLSEEAALIDTLYLSPLLFPSRPYHALLKDDKLQTEELNNPLNDAIKARDLFYDEVNAFAGMDGRLQCAYYGLLKDSRYFREFFRFVGFSSGEDVAWVIREILSGSICSQAPVEEIAREAPLELAYCLALLTAADEKSLIPRWVLMKFPRVSMVMGRLRDTSCHGCAYCKSALDPKRYLHRYFGYPDFRTYNGEPLQAKAVQAAVDHHSLLAIFPTGGGKSLTFQIPALMAGKTKRALTVVISPLQSLMKDQVYNLERRGIEEAVTINGLLSPIERAEAIERVESGKASMLYISPESLRSVTIERLLLSREVDRFVIDEAHCFSAWGQDFRVDYLYIGDFIRELERKKGGGRKIAVSCFTATAKQKVISDI
ncbi:MAG: DEAD/DEAH box helicase, partial [Blautia sp.]|nr:DEAD/DEAH box helicase [Blautia sp.]